MSFLYPAFLFALLTLSIPVIIHFFNFRKYKTLYFSNVNLLKLIKQESKKKSKLKQLIILLSRMLAIASIVFAFSRPYIPVSDRISNSAQQIVEVYIDNTFSMKNKNENGQLLEQAKAKAIDIANYYRPGTRYLLITSEFLPQHQYILTKEQFIQQVSEINESPRSPLFSEIYAQAVKYINIDKEKDDKIIYFISDFQKNSMDIENIKPDTSIISYFLPFKVEKTNNLLIDSCWFDIPIRKIGQQEKLFVHLKNLSEQSYQNIPVRLNINDSLRSIANVNIAGMQDTIIELNYTNNTDGIQLCKIELDDYPITYDNSFYLSYHVSRKMKALGIFNPNNNSSNFLKTLFANDEFVTYDEFSENNVQIGHLKDYQCIFMIQNQKISSGLKSELVSFVEQGGSIALIPNRSNDYNDYNALMASLGANVITTFDTSSMRIMDINYSHPLYNEVFKKQEAEADLPIIDGFYKFTSQLYSSEKSLLKFRNGLNALSTFTLGKGNVYSFAFPIDNFNFNFIRHIIFVPTFYNIVINSEVAQKYVYPIESEEPILLNQKQVSKELKLLNQQTKEEYKISTHESGAGNKQIIIDDLINEAGHYIIHDENHPIQSLSFNYPREESTPDFMNSLQIQDLLIKTKIDQIKLIDTKNENFSEVLKELNNGKQLWKLFIILTILFLFVEMAVIQFWK